MALPVVGLLPLWGYVYAGTLEPPTVEASGALVVGEGIFNTCAACHGADGGGGVGPALTQLGDVFSAPADQMHWVGLGSTGWQAEVGDTYGDTAKPVNGGMPAFAESLTPEELTSVVVYERTTFSGLDPVEEGLIDETGNLLVVYNPETGELDPVAG